MFQIIGAKHTLEPFGLYTLLTKSTQYFKAFKRLLALKACLFLTIPICIHLLKIFIIYTTKLHALSKV